MTFRKMTSPVSNMCRFVATMLGVMIYFIVLIGSLATGSALIVLGIRGYCLYTKRTRIDSHLEWFQ
jgi:hypothetical protein